MDSVAEPYDPLDYANLARSVVGALLRADRMPLPPERFAGSGVYAIYYTGPLEYTDRYSLGEVPIYVGKAVPAGARKGSRSANPATETSLQRRLSDHAKSIGQAENLIVTEAHCRYLVVESVWITLAEQSLLSYFRPLWNTVLDGFGNHNPGRGRVNSARPRWDIMHPGRSWASRLRANENQADIIAEVRAIESETHQDRNSTAVS